MSIPIRTAVFPVAGRGTRFLPATKACPKEMLPVVDKPLIQYAVEEAISAGVTKLVFVTGRTKRAIEDHFDVDTDLEQALEDAGQLDILERIRGIVPNGVSCTYLRQGKPLGLGHAVLCARPVVGDEPFFVHLADDLIAGGESCLKQMGADFAEHETSVVAVEEVPREDTSRYGVVGFGDLGANDYPQDFQPISSIVEKPDPANAPSNLAVVGRYLLVPAIFDLLEQTTGDAGGEIQLTDAIAALLKAQSVRAYRFAGQRFDCGSKLGYLKAIVAYGLSDPTVGARFADFLGSMEVNA